MTRSIRCCRDRPAACTPDQTTPDLGTAIRFAESIGYKGLYTIEVSEDAAVRVLYNAILGNLA
jgi:hypothetical protein